MVSRGFSIRSGKYKENKENKENKESQLEAVKSPWKVLYEKH